MATHISRKKLQRAAFMAAARAFDHMQRAEMMYGQSYQRQWYYELFARRHAICFPQERPEFPTYVGSDGREHAEF